MHYFVILGFFSIFSLWLLCIIAKSKSNMAETDGTIFTKKFVDNLAWRIKDRTKNPPDMEDTKTSRLIFVLEYLEAQSKFKIINLNFQHAFTDTVWRVY